MPHPCVFLDRDGVLNRDNVNYIWRVEDFEILPGVVEALQDLKAAGYRLIIITNQSGIAKGLYTADDVMQCYHHLQNACGGVIDAQYFAPHHPQYDTESLSRKPNSLMIERAIAKYDIDASRSWMVGDAHRDMLAAKRIPLRTIQVISEKAPVPEADFTVQSLAEAAEIIMRYEV